MIWDYVYFEIWSKIYVKERGDRSWTGVPQTTGAQGNTCQNMLRKTYVQK